MTGASNTLAAKRGVPQANLLYFWVLLLKVTCSRSEPQKLNTRCGWPTHPAVTVMGGRRLTDVRYVTKFARKHNHIVCAPVT